MTSIESDHFVLNWIMKIFQSLEKNVFLFNGTQLYLLGFGSSIWLIWELKVKSDTEKFTLEVNIALENSEAE